MVSKKTNTYADMGIGEDRGSPVRERGPKMPVRMSRPDDQSPTRLKLGTTNGAGLMMEVAIRCTIPSCSCECFTPGKMQIRYCETCKHGWVPHALDKLGFRHLYNQSQVEAVQPNVAFDIASLVLYGCQALPIRLKILLDRLFSVLQHEEVLQVLHGFGWTYEDYARGYILQDPHGAVLDRWNMCSRDEEPLVLQQFLRFGETRAITQQLLSQDTIDLLPQRNARIDSDIKKFIERTTRVKQEDTPNLPIQQQQQQQPTSNQTHQQSQRSQRPLSPPPTISSQHPHQSPHEQRHHQSAHHHQHQPTPQPPASRSQVPPPPPPSVTSTSHQLTPQTPSSTVSSLNFLKLPCIASAAPNGPTSQVNSPVNSTSPLSVSPLNRLQNMQPFDFRKERAHSPDTHGQTQQQQHHHHHHRRTSETSDTSPGLNLSVTSPSCLPPGPFPGLHAPLNMTSFSGLTSSKSDFSGSDYGSEDENSQSALNLSRDRGSLDPYSDDKRRQHHLRKASTPMKRQWAPINLGTQLINPATGKKRVQCNVCLKTFCDKGALKIHFSAVHLREMHKCTVEGCNMMFSSRRSRNRHSANPNPKLHSPHLRRKISPHDGRSAQPHPLLIPQSLNLPTLNPLAGGPLPLGGTFNPMTSFPLLTPPPDLQRHHSADLKQSLDLSMPRYEDSDRRMDLSVQSNTTTSSDDVAFSMNTNPDGDQEGIEGDTDDVDDAVGGGEGDEALDARKDRLDDEREINNVKRVKLSDSDMDEEMSNLDSNDSLSVDNQSLKEESIENIENTSSKGVRKRKSQNPTRCALPLEDDDDLSSDDSSNDVVFAEDLREEMRRESRYREEEKEEPPQVQKMEQESEEKVDKEESPPEIKMEKESDVKMEEVEKEESEKGDDMKEDDSKKDANGETIEDEEAEESQNNNDQNEIKTSLAPLIPADKMKKERTEKHDSDALSSEKNAPESASEESLDSSNALRQLESLSQGHFGDLVSRNLVPQPSLLPGSLQFPMGLVGGLTGPPSPAKSLDKDSNADRAGSGSISNPGSPSGDSQNALSHSMSHFRDTSFIGSVDVPIDKDNPRRCTACGKIFQNHFGVKTHYQNVHLKLMHKCTVEGCNAAFPSKRSRDRHSANLNLHRKLLSTSSDKTGLFLDKSPFATLASNPSLHSEFLARLYADTQALPLNLEAYKHLPTSLAEQMIVNGDRLPPATSLPTSLPPPPLLLPTLGVNSIAAAAAANLGGLTSFGGLNSFGHLAGVNGTGPGRDQSSGSESPSPPVTSSPTPTTPSLGGTSGGVTTQLQVVYSLEDDLPTPDREGFLPCKFCHKTFPDGVALKEHYEHLHLPEMFRCSVDGCNKVFSSRKKRNLHSQNEAIHRQSATPVDCS